MVYIRMKVVCIIPARGGSKGVPRKNVAMVAGKPLIAWTIEAALGARTIQRVVVSTDDREIGEVAMRYGAEVVWRPAELSGDTASSESALLHVLAFLDTEDGYKPDFIVLMQCTCPLTLPEDIDSAVEALMQNQADAVFTAMPFHGFVWRKHSAGDAVGINHDKYVRPRRQDREPEYLENGAVYVMRTDGFLEHKHRFFGKVLISEMPRLRTLDIDESADLLMAEKRLRNRANLTWKSRLAGLSIRALVLDFDGVMTDNRVSVDQYGNEFVTCSRGDGMGIAELRKYPIHVVVFSTEKNPVVAARCAKLGIECFQGVENKTDVFRKWCAQNGMRTDEAVYIGNDINDLACMQVAGVAAAPSDAHPAVFLPDTIRLGMRGGMGAVREVCDLLVAHFEEKKEMGS
jgi:YrbI family 3-deoxy-D-manno-octulosonate 8-phosphate phosphatase